MKKLKFAIMLALVPMLLTACGKSEEEKAKDGAKAGNQALSKAYAAEKEIVKMSRVAKEDGQVTKEEWIMLKAKAEECVSQYKRALAIDDSSSNIELTDRSAVTKRVKELELAIKVIEEQIASFDKPATETKVEPKKAI